VKTFGRPEKMELFGDCHEVPEMRSSIARASYDVMRLVGAIWQQPTASAITDVRELWPQAREMRSPEASSTSAPLRSREPEHQISLSAIALAMS